MSKRKNNFELELNEECIIIHLCPNRNSIHAWAVFASFAQWKRGNAPLYDGDKSIVGYTDSYPEYVISICKNLLQHDGKSLLIGFGHLDDFPNASTELFRSFGICPIDEVKYQNEGWQKWQ
tara:strand:+ start:765 stop:1127 length:363 start_codon:yes stop_codon:yes gene_type:complete